MQRSLLLFEESIKSKITRKNYTYQLGRFLKFTKIKDYDSLLELSEDQTQMILEDYVIHLKRTMSPNSIPICMSGVKHFFVMNRKKVYWETIQKMYPEQVRRSGQKSWTNQHIQKMLEYSRSKRNKAIIHLLASTGARIGIFDYPLQMKHLREMGDGCKSVLIYPGEKEEYWAFLTPEATTALEQYFQERLVNNEKFYPDTPIFRTAYRLGIEKPIPLLSKPVIQVITRLVNTSGIQREKVTEKRFDIQLDHGFRKRFNTILKINNDVNSNIAEKLMAHKNGLDGVYFTPTIEQCFEEFKKAIPELTIDDSHRKQAELDKANKEKSELQRVNVLNQTLQDKLDDVSMRMAKLEAMTFRESKAKASK